MKIMWTKIKQFVLCYVLRRHDHDMVEPLSDQAVLLLCPRCKKLFVYHIILQQILPWDLELQKFYEDYRDTYAAFQTTKTKTATPTIKPVNGKGAGCGI